jgi:PEP-CTERM motif
MKITIPLLVGLLLFTGRSAFGQFLSSSADSPVFDTTPYDVKPVYITTPTQSLATYHYQRTVENYDGNGNNAVTDITANGRGNYGDVGASVTANIVPYDLSSAEGDGILVGASGYSDDYITVTSPTIAKGTKGTYFINMFIEGSGLSSSADLLPEIYFNLVANNGSVLQAFAPGGFESAAIPFTYGTPFEVSMSINVDLRMENKNQETDPGLNVLANVSFLNSAIWDGDVVEDASGNLVTDAAVVGSGGNVYPLAVPEPSSTVMALAGVAGILAALRRGVRRI